jgi:hypothetical protein
MIFLCMKGALIFALSSCYWMFPAVILGEATVEEAMGVGGGLGALRIGVEVMVAVEEEEEDMEATRGI